MSLDQKALLEQFIVDNPDLERLESLLDQFNIFEAVGMVRQEIRHSHFLAFLLDPSASHQLGDRFLKAFLKHLLVETDQPSISPITIDVANLSDTEVRREWKHTDILLLSLQSNLVCVIENKVDSGLHSDQLQRYREIILQEFIGYQHLFIYLTRSGKPPTAINDRQHWAPYSYEQISILLDRLCDRYRSTLGSDVYTLIQHYSNLIKRHLMQDSDIAQLYRKIYQQHKEALDLIYEHRPNLESDILDLFQATIKQTPGLAISHTRRSFKTIGFYAPCWNTLHLESSQEIKRILCFELKIRPWEQDIDSEQPHHIYLDLKLNEADFSARIAIYNALQNSGLLAQNCSTPQPEKNKQSITLIRKTISDNVTLNTEIEEIAADLQTSWQSFLNQDLPAINQAILQAFPTKAQP